MQPCDLALVTFPAVQNRDGSLPLTRAYISPSLTLRPSEQGLDPVSRPPPGLADGADSGGKGAGCGPHRLVMT